MKCKFCGSNIDEAKMKFCGKCGAVIEPEEPAKVVCAHCGKEVKPGMKFCMHCGTAVEIRKVCVNCGNDLKENEKFCSKCGTPRNAKPDIISPVKTNNVVQPEKKPTRNVQSKKKQEVSSGFKLFDKSTMVIAIFLVIIGWVIQNWGGSNVSKYSAILGKYYPNLKEVVSVEKLSSNATYSYKFTIIEKCGSGVTCKQDGFIGCYDDGSVSDVVSYSDPYEFRDNKGNIFHDKTGVGLY